MGVVHHCTNASRCHLKVLTAGTLLQSNITVNAGMASLDRLLLHLLNFILLVLLLLLNDIPCGFTMDI